MLRRIRLCVANRRVRAGLGLLALSSSLTGALALGTQTAASAQTVFHVTPATFAGALATANSDDDGDTIFMAQGTYAGPVFIEGNVNLVGASESTTIIKGSNGEKCDAVVNIEGAVASVSTLTVTGGHLVDCEGGAGGIQNFEGELTLNRVIVTGNTIVNAAFGAGGIGNFFGGLLTLENSSVTRNTASDIEDCAGGVANGGEGAQLNVVQSVVSQNLCGPSYELGVGGIANGFFGIIPGPKANTNMNSPGLSGVGVTNITQSTISNNSTSVLGEDLIGSGGLDNLGVLFLSGDTVTGNSSSDAEFGCGGGLCNLGQATVSGGLISQNVVNGFEASFGGGVYNDGQLTTKGSGGVDLNTASYFGFGGGLFNDCEGTATLNGTTIQHNNAGVDGGGIFEVDLVSETGTSVSQNVPDDRDGGLDCTPIDGFSFGGP